jgi:hypothetical protein
MERAALVDRFLDSLDKPDEAIDRVWRKEMAAPEDRALLGSNPSAAAAQGQEATLSLRHVAFPSLLPLAQCDKSQGPGDSEAVKEFEL